MSNGPSSPVDFSQELSAFLASAVSNGTWADVIDALKVDAVPAQATDITAVAGQLWANVQDDLFKATWERLFSARKLWAFADAPARDGTGSDQGLAVGDVCTLTDTPGSFFVCDTVAATTSTWLPAGGSGGGLQPLVVQEAVWSAGVGTQVEAVPVGAVLYAIPGGGESSRPFQAQLPDSASVGERVGFQFFGAPELQPIEITTPSGTLSIEGPVSTGTLVTLFDATGELFDTAYLVWEYQIVLGSPVWKLVNYHQEPKAGGDGDGDGDGDLQGEVIFDLDFTAGPTLDLKAGGDQQGVLYEGLLWDIGGTAVASDVGWVNGVGFRIVNNASGGFNDGCWLSVQLFGAAAGAAPPDPRIPGFDPGSPWRLTIKFERITSPGGSQVYEGITKQPFDNCTNGGLRRNWVAQSNAGAYFGARGTTGLDSLAGADPTENVIVIDVNPRETTPQYLVSRGFATAGDASLPTPYPTSGLLTFLPVNANSAQDTAANAYLHDQDYFSAPLRTEAQLTRIFLGTDLNGEIVFKRWRLEQRAAL
jgi:hypothetical protein